ncbi:MAG: cysteine-rich CWC family protein [Caldimonas sp.]
MPEPASSCPLCGHPNGCSMTEPSADGSPCWCTGESFSAELLKSLPAAARGRACICARCARPPVIERAQHLELVPHDRPEQERQSS